MPDFLKDMLAAHLAVNRTDRDGLVFTSPTGQPLRLNHFRTRTFRPAVRDSVGEPCTPHDLRHTHVAILVAQGEHPKVIQQRLGHSSIRTTLDTYGHLFDGLDADAAAKLDAMFRRDRVGLAWG